MTEQGPLEPPRIALVFGDEDAAVHVREALDGHVDVVYATVASEFNPAQLANAGATAALVNLDGGTWPDPAEARWSDAGIPVVFNDAEVSRTLEGWNRARWSRHLVAKLTGSADFDPPRPAAVPDRVATETADARDQPMPGPPAPVEETPDDVIERPLSAAEIEAMTADFVAGQEAAARTTAGEDVDSAGPEPSAAVPEPDVAPASAGAVAAGDDLDVDTEALSAMIDARLAEPEASAPADASEVWRIVEDELPAEPATAEGDAALAAAASPVPVPPDDTDVFASLPSLDDWQLVEPDQQVSSRDQRASKAAEPTLPDHLAGLELLPMDLPETLATQHEDPIERWLDDSGPTTPAARDTKRSGTGGGAR